MAKTVRGGIRGEGSKLEREIRMRFEAVKAMLNERARRRWAAAEARAAGVGCSCLVSRATGIARGAIARGCRELEDQSLQAPGQRVRLPGGGAKPLIIKYPGLLADLEGLIEPTSSGDPESPLRWTCKRMRNLAQVLQQKGYPISHETVGQLLHSLDYSLQANRKT